LNHQEGTLTLAAPSEAAGAKLYFQSWSPDAAPKAIILLIHGYAEHSARYQYFAEHCVGQGYAVYALDHWGHGKSDGTYGFVPRFSVFHDGVSSLLANVRSNHPALPIILLGHSMGGLICASYLLENQSKFAGCVLSGPAIKAAEEPSKFMVMISRLLSRIAPKMGVLVFDPTGVSRDPKVVADYIADPLVYNGKMGARLAAEMLSEMTKVQGNAGKISLPMLMLHGAEDRATAVEGSSFLNAHISSTDKTLKIYPELFHEVFNEPEKDAVLTDMTDWIGERIASERTGQK